jgi:TonB family protein
MIPALTLQNFLSWFMQVLAVACTGTVLPKIFKVRDPRSHLAYCYVLVIACVGLPLMQPWSTPNSSNAEAGGSALGLAVDAVMWVLLAGILIKLGFFLTGLLRIHRYTTSAVPLQVPKDSVLSSCRLMDPEVVISVSAVEVGPAAVGWLHRTILLPASFLPLEEEAQRAILCHEFLHILHNDWLVHVCEELIGACFWFHPAIWWLLRQSRLAREQVIDSEVVRLTGAREPYLEALLTMAGAYSDKGTMPAPLFFRSHLSRRMRSLLVDRPVSRLRLLVSYTAMTILLGSVAWITVMTFPLMAAPQTQKPAAIEMTTVPSLAEASVESYEPGAGITPPRVVAHIDPEFSDAARQSRIRGTVLVEGIVQTDGTITGLNVLRRLDTQLDRNAVHALKQWRFEPGKLNGRAVPARIVIEVNFNLK